jgi:hypothetical protein
MPGEAYNAGFCTIYPRPPAVRINLPATFQFSPATSKSIDIPAS